METRTAWRIAGWGIALGAVAWGALAQAPLAPQPYQAAQARIAAQRKADDQACGRLQGNARDVCRAEAKGREKTARAELEARRHPSPDADREAKEAAAEADFAVARVRCAAQPKGLARDRCVTAAKAVREAAVRQAKVEKVQAESQERLRAAQARKGREPAEPSPKAQYAAARAWCQMQGTERQSCFDDLQRRFPDHRS